MASAMYELMASQPGVLRELLADGGPAEAAAERLRGRRVLLCGTGTSWHAANHGAWLLRAAGVEAWPVAAMDMALHGPVAGEGDALILLSHRGTKRQTTDALERARAAGAETVTIGGRGSPGIDLETSPPERSAAFTVSHTGALMRLAQLATLLGADLGPLDGVPDAVAEALAGPLDVEPPRRLLEFVGAGPNAWTAAEASLKVRETAYVAAEGLGVEQLMHGPSVALGDDDVLVAFDGGGAGEQRLAEFCDLVEAWGVPVHRLRRDALGEQLSVFPLTVLAQRIALDSALSLGTNPDSFGKDRPHRDEAWSRIQL
jgi:glucosamine--fructose-6-phosphate aminotransferase (isomerizing)